MMNEFVTVVIPTYNAEQFVKDALLSLENVKNIEIIVIDDGSTDGTISAVEDVKKKSKQKYRVIQYEHQGLGYVRNAALNFVDTEFVMFMDSDDIFNAEAFNKHLEVLKNNAADIITFSKYAPNSLIYLNSDTRKEIIFDFLHVKNNQLYNGYIAGAMSKLFRLDVLKSKNVKFAEDIAKGEDALFNVDLIMKANSIQFVNVSIYKYRNNPNSMSRNITYNIQDASKRFMECLYPLLRIEWTDEEINTVMASIAVHDIYEALKYKQSVQDWQIGDWFPNKLSGKNRLYLFLILKRKYMFLGFLQKLSVIRTNKLKNEFRNL